MSVEVAGASSAQRMSVARNAPNPCTGWSYWRMCVCSDGLHGYFQTEDEVLQLCADGELDECAEAAVALANQRGGKDNITAVVIEALE